MVRHGKKLLTTIANTFQPSLFRPGKHLRNTHFQTIVGSGSLNNRYFGPPARPFEIVKERFETPDGDFFDVEHANKDHTVNSDKVVIIVHGLEANIQGPLVTNFARAFLQKGYSCCLFSFRGCNGVENRTLGGYHVGFTTDLNQVVSTMHTRFPHKKLYLCGFSLGGNVSLKLLGEMGDEAESRGVFGAAVTCVPFDPEACQLKMDRPGFSRTIYSASFLETLKLKAELDHQKYPNAFDIHKVRRSQTIGDFDDAYIAAIYNFMGKSDYYRQSGSKWWLPKIRVPTIAINALDDPIIEESSLPTAADVGDTAPVRLIYHAHGGHCGFYTNQESMGAAGQEVRVPQHGWLAEELARAIEHIHQSHM